MSKHTVQTRDRRAREPEREREREARGDDYGLDLSHVAKKRPIVFPGLVPLSEH